MSPMKIIIMMEVESNFILSLTIQTLRNKMKTLLRPFRHLRNLSQRRSGEDTDIWSAHYLMSIYHYLVIIRQLKLYILYNNI